VNESNRFLRRLLALRGSYPIIAAAAASGQLHFPVTLFEHVGDVYRRVETAADHDCAGIEALRLAALVHEEPRESLPKLLGAADVCDFAPTVVAVTGGFGQAIPGMERAAEVGGLQAALKCWAERLAGAAPPNRRLQRTALRAAAEPPGR
jgi:hypothetical protein